LSGSTPHWLATVATTWLLISGSILQVQASPRVRLLIAVPDAEAYEQVMALVHDGKLTAMDGEAFVVVGDFDDAVQVHALGIALQRKLKLPFELVYDPLHPQSDLAWTPKSSKVFSSGPSRSDATSSFVVDTVVAEPLIYLYANPRDEHQQRQLAQFLNRSELHPESQGIRVGQFRDTPASTRLLRRQETSLQALGIPVQRYRRIPGSPTAVALVP
jgi:hypothetical protein